MAMTINVVSMKKRRLAESVHAPVSASLSASVTSKKQRLEEVSAIAKDVMIKLLSESLSYDVSDAQWQRLVELTQSHPHFNKRFTFPSDTEPGWVTPKKKKKASHLRIVALDCEMCVIVDTTSNVRRSNALCRVSAVDGDDMIRNIISDYIVHQPEDGCRLVDPKTDIHGITLAMIDQSKISVAKAQKQLLKYINADTIVVGHSVHGDLASLRIDHRRVIDTAMIYQRKGDDPSRATPGLKCLTKHLLQFEMPDGHDSAIDAQASMLAAKYAVNNECGNIIPSATELHGPRVREPATIVPSAFQLEQVAATSTPPIVSGRVAPRIIPPEDVRAAQSCRLRVHRIPRGVKSQDLEQFFIENAKVVPTAVENIVWPDKKQNKGSAHVTFSSNMHAQLAFEAIEAKKTERDTIGREQKIVAIASVKFKNKVFTNVKVGVM